MTQIIANPPVYKVGGGWGYCINWEGWKDKSTIQKVSGHEMRRPRVGDELLADMQSGKTARFTFTDVEYMLDPDDMFFATVTFVGYVE